MDVKTAFLNGDLDEEVYMKQPEGFVMPGNEHKVCKLVKSLYGLKQAPKQWHQKFDEVVLSSGFHLNQSDKCVYSKFDKSVLNERYGRSGRYSWYNRLFNVREKGIVITQSHYIEKILKKFNREDCSPVSTPMDPVEKLKPNTGKPVDQLEYSRAIGCLMYAMTSTRPDIAYADCRIDYGLSYVGYPSVLEGYSNANWINHVEDSSSTSGWVFLLGGGGGGEKKKKKNNDTNSGDASLDHPSKVNDGKNARSNATAGTSIITGSNIPSGTYNASIVLVISHTHNELNKGPILFVNVVNVIPTSPNKNGSEQVGNEPVTYEIPSS
ncbi:zinc finger, CCHC-type containing protein [Tanacetum coccineum]